MGFSSFHNSTQNPAQIYYKWSGGAKEIELPDGSKAKKPRGDFQYWDGEANQLVALPFTFCVLEQTRSITGFSPTPGQNVRFYSNEVVDYDGVFKVFRKDDSGTEQIAEGTYNEIKKKLPQGAKLQINLYFYNPTNDQIERFNMSGAALSAFIDFSKKNKGLYEHPVIMEAGEVKTVGTVDFIPPKFKYGPKYDDEMLKKLSEFDKQIIDYMNDKRDNGDTATSVGSIDQTPAQYQGEENQETGGAGEVVEADADEEALDLSEIPF